MATSSEWHAALSEFGAPKSSQRTARSFQIDVPQFAFACLPALQAVARDLAGSLELFQCLTAAQDPQETRLCRAQLYVPATALASVLRALDEHAVPFCPLASRVKFKSGHPPLPSALHFVCRRVFPELATHAKRALPRKKPKAAVPSVAASVIVKRKTLGARRPRPVKQA